MKGETNFKFSKKFPDVKIQIRIPVSKRATCYANDKQTR